MEGWQSLVYCDSLENYWGCVEHPPWVRIPHPLPLNTKGENMYKHLYDSFSHWYRGGSVYFWRLGGGEICVFSNIFSTYI